MESSSSMKMIAGEFFCAVSNATRNLYSDSPANMLMISGPLIRKKQQAASLATARAISVLPVPGGPYSSIPRGGYTHVQRYKLHTNTPSIVSMFYHAVPSPLPSIVSVVPGGPYSSIPRGGYTHVQITPPTNLVSVFYHAVPPPSLASYQCCQEVRTAV